MSARNTHPHELVDVVAQSIAYEIRGGRLYVSTHGIEVRDPGSQPHTMEPEDQRILVEFDAELTEEDAIFALRTIIEKIERTGLPREYIVSIKKRNVARFMKLQEKVAEWGEMLGLLPFNLEREVEDLAAKKSKDDAPTPSARHDPSAPLQHERAKLIDLLRKRANGAVTKGRHP
jgi:hypothetical protein